jgi:membrane protein DedA with SNARE-associated domain
MGRLVDAILGLSGPLAYLVVGGLAFGEAAAFVGLFLPGEVAVLLGGVLASEGQVSLPAMLAVACLAAVAGDSVGYEIGRRYGERILRTRLLRRHSAAVERARAYVQAKGGRAVFLGRWTGVLRALVPGLAGISGMPYRRFIVANIAGGVAWASTFVLLGYAAGASFRSVERYAGRAGARAADREDATGALGGGALRLGGSLVGAASGSPDRSRAGADHGRGGVAARGLRRRCRGPGPAGRRGARAARRAGGQVVRRAPH